jgi:dTDP-4-amino-4,6-dideoxygalactose transaminase
MKSMISSVEKRKPTLAHAKDENKHVDVNGVCDSRSEAAISWCPFKPFDFHAFQKYLTPSVAAQHVTNGGPLQKVLASRLAAMTGTHRAVVPVANGTAALHALVYAWALHRGRPLRWATQAFTFPSSMQAALADVIIVDLDADHHGPSVRDLEANKERLDGIIVTNVFGLSTDLSKYEVWCAENDKLMLLDNAATPLGTIDGRCIHDFGDGAMVSLHETKAIGRGEGGAAFVPKELERDFQRVICFGFDVSNGQRIGNPLASNYKLSDISAAAALSYLDIVGTKKTLHHLSQLSSYAQEQVGQLRDIDLAPWRVHEPRLWGCLPLSLPADADAEAVCKVLNILPRRIECKRYYMPLIDDRDRARTAWRVFDRTICLPLHGDMSFADVDYVLSALNGIILRGKDHSQIRRDKIKAVRGSGSAVPEKAAAL